MKNSNPEILHWRLRRPTLVLVLATIFQCGCENRPESVSEAPIPTASPVSNESETPGSRKLTVAEDKEFPGLRITIPAGWEERPLTSNFVLAEYQILGDDGPARITLSSAGGGVEANIQRWQGQFQRTADDPESESEVVSSAGGEEVTVVQIYGTFRDGFGGGGTKPGWAMLGAVLPDGDNNFFLKMTGPRSTVENARDQFLAAVTTMKLR